VPLSPLRVKTVAQSTQHLVFVPEALHKHWAFSGVRCYARRTHGGPMKKALTIVAIVLMPFQTSSAFEQGLILPEEQWNDETALWLARAMVSEADWSSIDHAAIAWTLKRQWEARAREGSNWTFLDQIRNYCAGLHGEVRSDRMKWVRSLEGDAQPSSWPGDVSWRVFAPAWAKVRSLAQAWVRGQVGDPCRGRAHHWGSPEDMRNPSRFAWKTVDCGPTMNIFWQSRSRLAP
jgi:hypothetical protein